MTPLLLLLLLLITGLIPPRQANALDCKEYVVGLDPSVANTAGGAVLDALGQTFVAPETIITGFSVWRAANQNGSVIGIRPYLVGTDSSGTPNVADVIAAIPTIVNPGGDGVNPVEFAWVFDPPIVLPRPGKYAFMMVQDPCAAYFDVIAVRSADGSTYADGEIWSTHRSSCTLIPEMDPVPDGDLIFRVRLCSDVPTSVHTKSWGKIKERYFPE